MNLRILEPDEIRRVTQLLKTIQNLKEARESMTPEHSKQTIKIVGTFNVFVESVDTNRFHLDMPIKVVRNYLNDKIASCYNEIESITEGSES